MARQKIFFFFYFLIFGFFFRFKIIFILLRRETAIDVLTPVVSDSGKLRRGPDGRSAVGAASTAFLRAVASSSALGARAVADTLRSALASATFAETDWLQNATSCSRVAGALVFFNSALQRPSLGDDVLIIDDDEKTEGVIIELSENAIVETTKKKRFRREEVFQRQLSRIPASVSFLEALFVDYSDATTDVHGDSLASYVTEAIAAVVEATAIREPEDLERLPPEHQMALFETPHPYPNGCSIEKEFSFPGADSVEICFDEHCCTEPDADFLAFYKDSTRRAHFGSPQCCESTLTFRICFLIFGFSDFFRIFWFSDFRIFGFRIFLNNDLILRKKEEPH